MSPQVSVVIPSYNHAGYLREAVDSVLAQTLPDLELIVVDDGSTDDSLRVLAGVADPRMRVVPQGNQGAHAAINRGLGLASGEYLAVLNSDDQYTPDRLEKLVGVLERNPALGIAGSHITVIDRQGRPLGVKTGYANLSPWALDFPARSFRAGTDLHAALLTENYFATTSNFVFTRRCWEQTGAFRRLRYVHDWDFALRAAPHFGLHLEPEPLMKYRVHNANTIRENKAAMIFEICWLLAVHLPRFDTPLEALTEKLTYSIHTYGCDRTLAVMLARGLAADEAAALQLLDPANADRRVYLDYIERTLAGQGKPGLGERLRTKWNTRRGRA